jgi:hypothetical protein
MRCLWHLAGEARRAGCVALPGSHDTPGSRVTGRCRRAMMSEWRGCDTPRRWSKTGRTKGERRMLDGQAVARTQGRMVWLDYLRGIAIIAVLVFHLVPTIDPSAPALARLALFFLRWVICAAGVPRDSRCGGYRLELAAGVFGSSLLVLRERPNHGSQSGHRDRRPHGTASARDSSIRGLRSPRAMLARAP